MKWGCGILQEVDEEKGKQQRRATRKAGVMKKNVS